MDDKSMESKNFILRVRKASVLLSKPSRFERDYERKGGRGYYPGPLKVRL